MVTDKKQRTPEASYLNVTCTSNMNSDGVAESRLVRKTTPTSSSVPLKIPRCDYGNQIQENDQASPKFSK